MLQVAIVSEDSWFHSQHRSPIHEYNVKSGCTALSRAFDRFEVTLSEDLGRGLQETHQLVVPPVQCIPADKLQMLPSVARKHFTKPSVAKKYEDPKYKEDPKCKDKEFDPEEVKEYGQCAEALLDVTCKAQVLMQCVYDALSDVGVEDIGQLFSGPISLHRDKKDAWGYRVHGRYVAEGADLSVNTTDNRKRLFETCEHSGDGWVY